MPVLWDKKTGTTINNESGDILRMLNSGFGALAAPPTYDLYPAPYSEEIDRWNERLYDGLNNGVYRAGFVTTQKAYNAAFEDVFQALDEVAAHLDGRTYMIGE